LTDNQYSMDFATEFLGSNMFDEIFQGKVKNPFQGIPIGEEVTAQISPFIKVEGTLVSLPSNLVQFCVVDGTITKSGTTVRDSRILVPMNLLKVKQ
jgi:hypothetical protein